MIGTAPTTLLLQISNSPFGAYSELSLLDPPKLFRNSSFLIAIVIR